MTEYNQNNQDIETQFNVGRDQVIHNLIIVGQFLDFAKVEGLLLPKPSSPKDFSSVVDAFEQTFSKSIDEDLTESAAFAGEVLQDAITRWSPKERFSALPFRAIMRGMPDIIYAKLQKLNYWDAFAETEGGGQYIKHFISLHSLSMLWNKHFSEKKDFRLYAEKSYCHFSEIDYFSISQKQFRVFIAGLIVDLMRLHSIGADDVKYWQGIVDLVSPKPKPSDNDEFPF